MPIPLVQQGEYVYSHLRKSHWSKAGNKHTLTCASCISPNMASILSSWAQSWAQSILRRGWSSKDKWPDDSPVLWALSRACHGQSACILHGAWAWFGPKQNRGSRDNVTMQPSGSLLAVSLASQHGLFSIHPDRHWAQQECSSLSAIRILTPTPLVHSWVWYWSYAS